MANFISSGANASTAFIAAQAIEQLLNQRDAELAELRKELAKTEFGDKHSYDQRYHCFSCLGLRPVHHEKCDFTRLMHGHIASQAGVKGGEK